MTLQSVTKAWSNAYCYSIGVKPTPNVTVGSQTAKRVGERDFMPKIGYARVSSSSQDLDIQKAKLVAVGCEVIRSETTSGAFRDD